MKSAFIFQFYILVCCFSYGQQRHVGIAWVNSISGDFSFAKRKSISCTASCYELSEISRMRAIRKNVDTVHCYTESNVATHCRLELFITKDSCLPVVVLTSIVKGRSKVYPNRTGRIAIDRRLWKRGILKADFDFTFENLEDERPVFWKGKVYTKIVQSHERPTPYFRKPGATW